MKKYLKHIFIYVFIGLVSFVYGQNPVSYPLKVVNGVEYYVYTVQIGEGLYSISKRFGVSQSDINNINPQIQDGLKAGAVILIPKSVENIQQVSTKSETETQEYILHKVEKKQTLFAISRLYNVPQDEILKANPEITDGLRLGDTIRIPVKRQTTSVKEKKDTNWNQRNEKSEEKQSKDKDKKHSDKNNLNPYTQKDPGFTIHKVQSKETLYSLSRLYNVTVEDIIQYNPEAGKKLKSGMELRIPLQKKNTQTAINTVSNSTIYKKPFKKDTYKIAYLLPFMLDDSKAQDATIYKFLEFYKGSLLAIREARKAGVNYEIYTFDTEKTESKLYSVINKAEMLKMDLIVGPAYTSQIPILTDFARRRKIYTIVPFSSNVDDIENNPYIFQFNPDKSLQNAFVVNSLKTKFQDANIILVDIDNSYQSDEDNNFFNHIDTKLDRANVNFIRVSKSDLVSKPLQKYLISGRRNVLIFDTYKLSSVQPYLNDLYEASKKYDIGVIGQYSWRDEKGKKPKMYYVSPFMADSERNTNASTYEAAYTHYYGKLRGDKNPRYDIIGYDITKYFLSLMKKDDFRLNDDIKNAKVNGIQSDMFFKRMSNNGGFINQQLFLIEDPAKRN